MDSHKRAIKLIKIYYFNERERESFFRYLRGCILYAFIIKLNVTVRAPKSLLEFGQLGCPLVGKSRPIKLELLNEINSNVTYII